MISVGHQVSVELPEILGELLQEVAMGEEAWRQFLVMAIFMDPTHPRDTQRVSKEGEKALKNWQRRQKCVFLRENE